MLYCLRNDINCAEGTPSHIVAHQLPALSIFDAGVAPVFVTVSGGGVAKATLIILGLVLLAYFITMITDILVVFFVAFLLAAAMEPTIDALNKRKIPRGVAVISFYIIVIFILGFTISYIVPILAQQIYVSDRPLGAVQRADRGLDE